MIRPKRSRSVASFDLSETAATIAQGEDEFAISTG
jgi:hypothetical protein